MNLTPWPAPSIHHYECNYELCDYGLVSALVAALVLERRGGYELETYLLGSSSAWKASLITDGRLDSASNCHTFHLEVQGPKRTLTLSFMVDLNAVHPFFQQLASIVDASNEFMLPLILIEHLWASFHLSAVGTKLQDQQIDNVGSLIQRIALARQSDVMILDKKPLPSRKLAFLLDQNPDEALMRIGPHAMLEAMLHSPSLV